MGSRRILNRWPTDLQTQTPASRSNNNLRVKAKKKPAALPTAKTARWSSRKRVVQGAVQCAVQVTNRVKNILTPWFVCCVIKFFLLFGFFCGCKFVYVITFQLVNAPLLSRIHCQPFVCDVIWVSFLLFPKIPFRNTLVPFVEILFHQLVVSSPLELWLLQYCRTVQLYINYLYWCRLLYGNCCCSCVVVAIISHYMVIIMGILVASLDRLFVCWSAHVLANLINICRRTWRVVCGDQCRSFWLY